jgi:hypothetical protein
VPAAPACGTAGGVGGQVGSFHYSLRIVR